MLQSPANRHVLSTGRVCESPFVARGRAAMIFGGGDLHALRRLFERDRYQPVTTSDGRGCVCLWLTDFLDSTVGPYRELTLTVIVAQKPLVIDWVNGLTPVAAQLHPEALICEYVLLLDNPDAIAYGRELHGFDKHAGSLRFEHGANKMAFTVEEGGELVVRGEIPWSSGLQQAKMLAGLVRANGTLGTLKALSRRRHQLRVVTPKVVRQHRSDIFFRGRAALHPYNHRLECGGSRIGRLLAALQFAPTVVQRVDDASGEMPLPLD